MCLAYQLTAIFSQLFELSDDSPDLYSGEIRLKLL
jgi:hypothetical protein